MQTVSYQDVNLKGGLPNHQYIDCNYQRNPDVKQSTVAHFLAIINRLATTNQNGSPTCYIVVRRRANFVELAKYHTMYDTPHHTTPHLEPLAKLDNGPTLYPYDRKTIVSSGLTSKFIVVLEAHEEKDTLAVINEWY